MTLSYSDLTGYVMTHAATRYEPADYDEVECAYDYDVDDGDVAETLQTFVDGAEGKPLFEDYASLERYVDENFDELCEEYEGRLLDYYRDDAQEDFTRKGGYEPRCPED